LYDVFISIQRLEEVEYKLKTKSKGQITMFIILGIIILFVVALAVYMRGSLNTVRPPVQQLIVAEEIEPIQVFVTDCLAATSKDALIRLGQNGGFISIPTGLKINPTKPYDSEVLFFPPQIIPYWYYSRPCPTSSVGCIYMRNPWMCEEGKDCALPYTGPNSMEEQMNIFIEQNIATCLDNFASFTDRFDIKTGKINVDTRIAEEEVGFKLEYPLLITIKGSNMKEEIPYFYAEHKLNLKQIYQFAQEIRDAQANYTFLERNTLNLITIYSGIDTKLPPMSELDMFTPGKKIWIRTEVKNILMSDILPYTMLLQIVNAGNAKYILPRGTDPKYIPFEMGFYEGMMLKVSETNIYPDLNVNLYYPPGSDIYFRIGNSEVIKPKSFDSGENIILKMMSYAVTDYSFKYDLTYPVIVRIEDPNAFNGQGYVFSYALQANIRQNVPVTMNMTTATVINSPTIDIEDITLRVNRTVTIEAYDKYTKQPLEEVQIHYRCGYDTFIGATAMSKGKAIFQDKFPFCEFGGEIFYERQGYMSGAVDYTNNEGTDAKTFRIDMWPLQEKKFKVYKRTKADINSIRNVGAGGIVLYNTAYTSLNSNDTVFVNVNKVKQDSRESDVPLVGFSIVKDTHVPPKIITKQDQIAYVNKVYDDGLIDKATRDSLIADLNLMGNTAVQMPVVEQEYVMEFVPGTYLFDAFMMYTGQINIPAKNGTICPLPVNLFGGEICVMKRIPVNYPAQNFTSWVSGGAILNFTLTEYDVYSNNTLIFYVAEMPLPKNWDDLESAPDIETYQKDMLTLLRPAMKYG
jgi:hypothetical protein